MKEEYYVGQTIELIVDNPDDNVDLMCGDRGVIKAVHNSIYYDVGVDFERNFTGSWDCNCGCEHGWNLKKYEFRVVTEDDDSEVDFDELLFGDYINDLMK